MKNRRIILILIVLVISIILGFSFSLIKKSQKAKSHINFNTFKTIELPLPFISEYNNLGTCRLFISNDDSILIVPFISDKKIVYYSLKNQSILKQIDFSKTFPKKLTYIYPINIDTFFLAYAFNGYSFEENLNDSILQILIVRNQELQIKYISLPHNSLFCKKTSLYKTSTYVYPSFMGGGVFYHNNHLIIPYNRLTEYNIGSADFFSRRFPPFGILNLSNYQLTHAKFDDYPYISKGNFYPSDIVDKHFCIKDNKILLRYFYSSDIFIFDFDGNFIKKQRLPSFFIDSIYPYKEERRNFWVSESINAFYLQLLYDQYRKYLYSYVYYPFQRYGKSFFSLIIADSTLKPISELIFDFKISLHSIFLENYIISVYSLNDKLLIKYISISKNNMSKNDWISQINLTKDSLKKMEIHEIQAICNIKKSSSAANDILQYITEVQKIKDSIYCCIYIYTDFSCEPCVRNVLFDFMLNKNNYDKLPIYLHLSGSKNIINKYLSQYQLTNFKKLYIDTAQMYRYFDKYSEASTRMVFVNKGYIISDTIYSPIGIDTMMNYCFELFSKYF
ncbi:MAG: hypothetical protein N2449_09355 [Bacteroidales bacterium]|nr:hypothetical protein [Bacteroidales bacterium]